MAWDGYGGVGVSAGSVLDKIANRKDLALSPPPLLTVHAHHLRPILPSFLWDELVTRLLAVRKSLARQGGIALSNGGSPTSTQGRRTALPGLSRGPAVKWVQWTHFHHQNPKDATISLVVAKASTGQCQTAHPTDFKPTVNKPRFFFILTRVFLSPA